MARYIGPVCKLCRREGMKLFLKGERCYTEKCAYTRRPYPPGQHGQGRIKLSEYAVRLREKQKVRRVYGILERQFQAYYAKAAKGKGRTGEEMLGLLESRLDNVVHRMGFATTRPEARQLVKHNHVLVNGKRVNIPSVILRPGDKLEIREESRKIPQISASLAQVEKRAALSWLDLDKNNFSGVFKGAPVRDELNEPAIREQLVVEYYSR
jgi:small subunit ribosomal protein S4